MATNQNAWRERERSSSKSSDLTSSASFHSPPCYQNNYDSTGINLTRFQESIAMTSNGSAFTEPIFTQTTLLPAATSQPKPRTLRIVAPTLFPAPTAQPKPLAFGFEIPPSFSSSSVGASTSVETNTSDVSKDDVDRAYKNIVKFLGPIQQAKTLSSGVQTSVSVDAPQLKDFEMLANQIRGLSDRVDRCNNNSNKFVDVIKALTAKVSRIEKENKNQNEALMNMLKELKEQNEAFKSKIKEMEDLNTALWRFYSSENP